MISVGGLSGRTSPLSPNFWTSPRSKQSSPSRRRERESQDKSLNRGQPPSPPRTVTERHPRTRVVGGNGNGAMNSAHYYPSRSCPWPLGKRSRRILLGVYLSPEGRALDRPLIKRTSGTGTGSFPAGGLLFRLITDCARRSPPRKEGFFLVLSPTSPPRKAEEEKRAGVVVSHHDAKMRDGTRQIQLSQAGKVSGQ